MDRRKAKEEMVDILENYGYITINNEKKQVSITSIDDKEGYSYISQNHEKFQNSIDAVQWAINQFDGIVNIKDWKIE